MQESKEELEKLSEEKGRLEEHLQELQQSLERSRQSLEALTAEHSALAQKHAELEASNKTMQEELEVGESKHSQDLINMKSSLESLQRDHSGKIRYYNHFQDSFQLP